MWEEILINRIACRSGTSTPEIQVSTIRTTKCDDNGQDWLVNSVQSKTGPIYLQRDRHTDGRLEVPLWQVKAVSRLLHSRGASDDRVILPVIQVSSPMWISFSRRKLPAHNKRNHKFRAFIIVPGERRTGRDRGGGDCTGGEPRGR